jgi:hypothetical protein
LRALNPALSTGASVQPWFEYVDSESKYVVLHRDKLFSAIQSNGPAVIIDTLKMLFSREVGKLEFERANYPLALWLASACCVAGIGYAFEYDTLQHTAAISFEFDASQGSTGKARTAFIEPRSRLVRIHWRDRTWNPLSSGFIIVGE